MNDAISSGATQPHGKATLQRHFDAGNYYEALQFCRAVGSRLIGQGKLAEFLETTFYCMEKLHAAGQLSSVEDLTKVVVDALTKTGTPVELAEVLDRIKSALTFLKPTDAYQPDRQLIVNRLVAWSKKVSPQYCRGHPLLHQCIGEAFLGEGDLAASVRHFQWCQNGKVFARVLSDHQMKNGLPSEIDLTIAQAVFLRLCFNEIAVAEELFRYYCEFHDQLPSTGKPPFASPLMNCVYYVIDAVKQKNFELYTLLMNNYSLSIQRDPSFSQYLNRISRVHFGAPSSTGNTYQKLLNTFFSNGTEEEDRCSSRNEAHRETAAMASTSTNADLDTMQADDELD